MANLSKSSWTNPLLTLVVSSSLALGVTGCGQPSHGGQGRWVTTQNSAVDIDWDAVGAAYKAAEGPEDLERRVNEIYTGNELISIAVADEGETRQVVTGFFDKNQNGDPEEAEKIFSIQRTITGEGSGQMQVQGYGPYRSYRSPMWDIASGMFLGSMISRAFRPGYRPMYTRPYVTPVSRHAGMRQSRSSFRSANPSKFSRKGTASRSGRRYGRSNRGFGGSRPRMRMRGGRFGAGAHERPRVRVTLG